MKLAYPRSTALAAALALGAMLSPAMGQDSQAPQPAPAAPPQAASPAQTQTTPMPILPSRARGDCGSKAKNLTS